MDSSSPEEAAKRAIQREARLAVLSQFASALVHDLRTPLTVMRYALDSLRRTLPRGPDTTEMLETINDELKDMDRSLAMLVEINHEWECRPEQVDLAPLLKEVAAKVDPNGQIDWVYDLRSEPIRVWADRIHFQQAIRNVVQNAYRAMKGRGTIRISARRQESAPGRPAMDVVEIADTGPGIAPQVRHNLFDPFVSTKNPGMGLGLTYCQVVMKKHGGAIEVADSSPSGTTFRLTMPPRNALV